MKSKFATQIRNFLDVSGLKPGSASPLNGAMDGVMQAFKTVFQSPVMKPVRVLSQQVRAPQARLQNKHTPRFGKPKNIWE